MPTYDYHCEACGASYELRQGFDAEATHTCEQCNAGTAKRVLHPPRVVFKGSGWYVTDSKKSSSASPSASEAADGTDKAEKKAEPAAESKPAASSESAAPAAAAG